MLRAKEVDVDEADFDGNQSHETSCRQSCGNYWNRLKRTIIRKRVVDNHVVILGIVSKEP